MAQETIRCLYCNEPYEFISGTRLDTQFGNRGDSFASFKDWVAATYDVDRDHEVFHTAGALTRSETHREYEHLFERGGEHR